MMNSTVTFFAALVAEGYRWWIRIVCMSLMIGTAIAGVTPICLADDIPNGAGATGEPQYPLAVAIQGETIYVVDLDLPGVWAVRGEQRQLFARGSNRFREPLNRPRCVAIHPAGGILVGDSATREVYHIASHNADRKPLSGGGIGIAMVIAVSPDGEMIYVGDAETRAILRLPLDGGDPETVVGINARGLAFDDDGALWAVTPDDAAIHRIDVEAKTSDAVITGRPYQYPNGLTWLGAYGLVTDGYGKSIWQFTADGETQPWLEGAPLLGPVGIASDERSVWVADPKSRQVFQIDRESKEVKTHL